MTEVINFTKTINVQLINNQLNFIREIYVISLYSCSHGLHESDGREFHLLKYKNEAFH